MLINNMDILGLDCEHSQPELLLYKIFYFCSAKCVFGSKWVIMCDTHRTGVGCKPSIFQNACLDRMITKSQITQIQCYLYIALALLWSSNPLGLKCLHTVDTWSHSLVSRMRESGIQTCSHNRAT